MGKHGLRPAAELCYHKSHYAAQEIAQLAGYSVNTDAPFFKEFVVTCPRPVKDINAALFNDHNIIGGYDVSKNYMDRANQMLFAVPETKTKTEIDALIKALPKMGKEKGHGKKKRNKEKRRNPD